MLSNRPEELAHALRMLLTDPARRESLARGAIQAGRALPGRVETARIVGRVLTS